HRSGRRPGEAGHAVPRSLSPGRRSVALGSGRSAGQPRCKGIARRRRRHAPGRIAREVGVTALMRAVGRIAQSRSFATGDSDMRTDCFRLSCCLLPLLLFVAAPAMAQTSAETPDIPSSFTAPTDGYDYERREAMIPMRDGVKLHTVIIVPRGAKDAPILLSRTPYNADSRTTRMASPNMIDVLPENDEVFVRGGYIR